MNNARQAALDGFVKPEALPLPWPGRATGMVTIVWEGDMPSASIGDSGRAPDPKLPFPRGAGSIVRRSVRHLSTCPCQGLSLQSETPSTSTGRTSGTSDQLHLAKALEPTYGGFVFSYVHDKLLHETHGDEGHEKQQPVSSEKFSMLEEQG